MQDSCFCHFRNTSKNTILAFLLRYPHYLKWTFEKFKEKFKKIAKIHQNWDEAFMITSLLINEFLMFSQNFEQVGLVCLLCCLFVKH